MTELKLEDLKRAHHWDLYHGRSEDECAHLKEALMAETVEYFELQLVFAQKARWAARYALPVGDYFHPDNEFRRMAAVTAGMKARQK